MGFYRSYVFPLLCDWTLGQPAVARLRKELLAAARGHVLEIGVGTGLNLAHYPADVRKITTADPNPGMNRRARRRAERAGVEVDQRLLSGESLPFPDSTFDCAVCTFTLCSVADPGRALAEVCRVLKPGAQFLFLEHGLSPDPGVQKWQHRLNGLQKLLGDGCHLDRDMRGLVGASPFASVRADGFYLEKTPRTHGYLTKGVALR
jgi:ubiquinone/menaquinone biosynthesis C-methylase UbiE